MSLMNLCNDRDRAYRCALPKGHVGPHCAPGGPSPGVFVEWPQTPAPDVAAAPSFDELLGHLDDLAALAEHERFAQFAGALRALRRIAAERRTLFGARVDAPTPEK